MDGFNEDVRNLESSAMEVVLIHDPRILFAASSGVIVPFSGKLGKRFLDFPLNPLCD
jgi:hypothetical protein